MADLELQIARDADLSRALLRPRGVQQLKLERCSEVIER